MKKDLEEAANWIKNTTGSDEYTISPLRQEASSRSYYRITTNEQSYILAIQSKEAPEKNFAASGSSAAKFLYAAKLLENNSVRVPEIYAFSEDLHFMLQEDLGDVTLDTHKKLDNKIVLEQALDQLSLIYSVDQDVLKAFSYDDLFKQTSNFLNIFKDRNITLSKDEIALINALRKKLVELIMNQPFLPTHNDFERRNFIYFKQQIYIIDFQDLNVGPMGMDLASLLYEHDFDYPEDLINELLQKHCERNGLGFDAKQADILTKQVLTHRSMRCVALLNDFNKQGKLLNRKDDIDKFIKRIHLGLSSLKFIDEIHVIEKLL
ncbi:MAG: hypothetical protein CBD12_001190 [Amoebophilaceae bacterium TMED152]|nr:hypothetical protein [Gammaproteobacteria bacterium]RPH01986.1 MAG: hypothetical protein CBD12_001190 [Amoebophilaceae bacterium TMED152]